jgi:hypothetical protein
MAHLNEAARKSERVFAFSHKVLQDFILALASNLIVRKTQGLLKLNLKKINMGGGGEKEEEEARARAGNIVGNKAKVEGERER